MADKNTPKPVRLTKVAYESQAAVIMTALEARGIQVNSTGGFTSGFRAESPGMVEIWVHEQNLEDSRSILANLKQESEEIDWSKVDTGDDSPLSIDEFIDDTNS